MTRTERLLQLMQILRQHRYPVSGATLAAALGISLRSLYRDIATLQAQGAHIEGEAGVGYLLRPGFLLPPLMFSEEEVEALALGSQWVAKRGDGKLAEAARSALARIMAVLPPERVRELETTGLLVGPGPEIPVADGVLETLREAIRRERKLRLCYRDADGRESERVVWPVALGYFEQVRMLAAWCELRQAFRHFRADRMVSAAVGEERYPGGRMRLVKAWREAEGIGREK